MRLHFPLSAGTEEAQHSLPNISALQSLASQYVSLNSVTRRLPETGEHCAADEISNVTLWGLALSNPRDPAVR